VNAVPLFVELTAGLGSVSLRLQGGPHCRPPVSRMGNKAGYAGAILEVLGLRSGQGAESFLWCEPDDGCRALLQAYPQPEVLRAAAEIIRSWADEDPRELWERLRAEGPIRGADGGEVARYVLIGAWAFRQGDASSGFHPLRAYGSVWRSKTGPDGQAPPLTASKVASKCEAVAASEIARWARITTSNRLINLDPQTWRNTGQGGTTHGGEDFSTGAEDLARGFEPSASTWPPVTVCADAREVEPGELPEGTVAYMDPPYQGTTGYGNDLPRAEVVELARRWADAGAGVCISEAEALPELMADGWHSVEITGCRKGQKRTFSKQQREFLTLNRAPAWRPSTTLDLFGGK
jgi:hypothetical protein